MPDEADPAPNGRGEEDRRFRRRFGRGFLIAGALAIVVGVVVLLAIDRDDGAGSRSTSRSASGRTLPEGFDEVAATVTPAGSDRTSGLRALCVLLAATTELREQGLMHVTDRSLGDHSGMLFSFPTDTAGSFWMRNTPMPLSIAFFDASGLLVSTADMAPCGDSSTCPTYAAAGAYRYALEVPKGRLPRLGITKGSRLRVGGDCPRKTGTEPDH